MGMSRLSDVSDEVLDRMVRKHGNAMRDNNRVRLQEIAQDVAAHKTDASLEASNWERMGKVVSPVNKAERAKLFEETRKRILG